jgi:hypothetical protein
LGYLWEFCVGSLALGAAVGGVGMLMTYLLAMSFKNCKQKGQ